MNGKDNNADKTTIRVCISNDDYQDVVLDWSKEMTDIQKSIFQQLSLFTGIPSEKTYDIDFCKPNGGSVYPRNPFCHGVGYSAFLYLRNPDFIPRQPADTIYTKRQIKNKFFKNGDCFSFMTKLMVTPTLDKILVEYFAVHQDLIDETECSGMFCNHSSNRAFLNKQVGILNSNIESYLRNQPPLVEIPQEHHRERLRRLHRAEIEILKDFNVNQYFNSYCTTSRILDILGRPRLYCPSRG